MNCIACKEPMIVLELNRVEVDFCLDCGGTWLDSGELGLMLGDDEKARRTLDIAVTDGAISPGRRKCPICRRPMDEVRFGSKESLRIDRCQEGHGMWFDRGELHAVIELLGGVAGSPVGALLQDIFGENER